MTLHNEGCISVIHFFIYVIVDVLQKLTSTMGATYWKFNADSCQVDLVGINPQAPPGSESKVDCECNSENNTICHVVTMYCISDLLFNDIVICSL